MNKRPLLSVALLLVLVILGLKFLGMPLRRDIPREKEIAAYLQEKKEVMVCGTVEHREEKEKTNLYYLRNAVLILSSQQLSMKQIYIIAKKEAAYPVGSMLTVQGEFSYIGEPGNPGQFDAAQYYHAQGIYYMGFVREVKSDGRVNQIKEFCEQLRSRMAQYLGAAAGEDTGAVLSAILLGEKSSLTQEIREQYRIGGILHILCISGLHITMLGMGIFGVLRRVHLPLRAAAGLSFLVLAVYGSFTGNNAATLRAVVIFAIVLGAKVTKRSFDFLSALSLAAILMLLENPEYLFYSGFILSFAAVFCAAVLVPLWSKQKTGKKGKWALAKKRLWDGALLWLFLLPVTAYYYYEVMPLGILVNFIFLPLVPAVLGSGFAGLLAGAFLPGVGKILLFPANALLTGLSWILGTLQKTGSFSLLCGQPPLAEVFLIYAGLGTLTYLHVNFPEKQKKILFVLLFWMLTLLVPKSITGLEITALDVGQGDGLVLRTADRTFLVDGGSSTEKELGKYCLLPYLKSQGICTLDGILLTHPDADHINGAMELLEEAGMTHASLRVKGLYLPVWMEKSQGEETGRLLELAWREKIPVYYLKKGMGIKSGKLYLKVLHPDTGEYEEKPNEGSLVLKVYYGNFCGLLTGDLEKEAEQTVVPLLEHCDYLKVGHHGSREGSSEEFLKRVSPRIGVISCGRGNRYGHPHTEVLERLEDVGCEVYLTWQRGAVTVRTDGEGLWVECFRKNDDS